MFFQFFSIYLRNLSNDYVYFYKIIIVKSEKTTKNFSLIGINNKLALFFSIISINHI